MPYDLPPTERDRVFGLVEARAKHLRRRRHLFVGIAGGTASLAVVAVAVALSLGSGAARSTHVVAAPPPTTAATTGGTTPPAAPTLPPLPSTTSTVPATTIPPASTTTTAPVPVCPSPVITQFASGAAGTQPGDMAVGADGNVWYADPGTHAISTISRSGHVSSHPLPAGAAAFAITEGPDGNLWFTDNVAGAIGRMTPTGTVTEFPTPTRTSNPMGVVGQGSNPFAITPGPDGALWFTESMADKIGRINVAGVITEYDLPSRNTVHANPEGIAAGTDRGIWFTEVLNGKIGRIDPLSHGITEVDVGGGAGLVAESRMIAGPDGRLWSELPAGVLAVTTGGVVSVYGSPALDTLAAGPGHAIWGLDSSRGSLTHLTTAGSAGEITIPGANGFSGDRLGTVMTPDGALWFSLGSAGKVGRLVC